MHLVEPQWRQRHAKTVERNGVAEEVKYNDGADEVVLNAASDGSVQALKKTKLESMS